MYNKKNIIVSILSFIVVVSVLVLVFIPFKGLDLPGTLKDFNSKTVLASDVNDSKLLKSKDLHELRTVIKTREAELDDVLEASEVTQGLFEDIVKLQEESGDWTYHVPSLLIELEKNADLRNINVAMLYETFSAEGEYVSSSGKGLQYLNVKVDIYGEYHNVKEYIKSLEKIDFVSVEDLVLTRVGSGDLVGSYNLNIYYLDR